MIFRQTHPQEREIIFREGYKEWSKNRTFEQYCADNAKEDDYGTRYVLDEKGEIVSSLILLKLGDIGGKRACGIGSVLTPKAHSGKGYATELMKNTINTALDEVSYILLFSDISPDFYKRFGFRILPTGLQRCAKSTCMVYCSEEDWEKLISISSDALPDYF